MLRFGDMIRASLVASVIVGSLSLSPFAERAEAAEEPRGISLRSLSSETVVTLYGATWCPACKSLEKELRERNVPFDLIDVDQNAKAYEAARQATGKSVIPLTSIARAADDVAWVVGADADAVEKAYRSP